MGVKKVEVKIDTSWEYSWELHCLQAGCDVGLWSERWDLCVCTPLDNMGRAWEQGGSLWTPSFHPVPSLHAGRDFSKKQQGRCQIQSLVLIPWKSQPMDFSFTLLPFLLPARICKVRAHSLHPWIPCHPTPLPEAGILPGSPPEPLTPPPPPSEQRALSI